MLNHGPRDSKDSENLEVLLGEGPAALAGRDDNLSGNTGDGTRVGGGQTCGRCHRAQPAVIGTMDIGDAKGNQEACGIGFGSATTKSTSITRAAMPYKARCFSLRFSFFGRY